MTTIGHKPRTNWQGLDYWPVGRPSPFGRDVPDGRRD